MKKIGYSIIIGFIITVIMTVYSNSIQADLADNIVRLHIIANSDADIDQAIKLKVRDSILSQMGDDFSQTDGMSNCKEKIKNNISLIEKIANEELIKNNVRYTAKASYTWCDFPTKKYGNIMMPAGNYEAVRVVLGDGCGKNWWCVMYPPLCFVDEAKGEMKKSENDKLENNLSSESYDIISDTNLDVEIKFKVVEIFQEGKKIIKNKIN